MVVEFLQESCAPFFRIIFIKPPFPAASYFEGGFVITSTFTISLAENPLKKLAKSFPVNGEILPLIIICVAPFPKIDTAPFWT